MTPAELAVENEISEDEMPMSKWVNRNRDIQLRKDIDAFEQFSLKLEMMSTLVEEVKIHC